MYSFSDDVVKEDRGESKFYKSELWDVSIKQAVLREGDFC